MSNHSTPNINLCEGETQTQQTAKGTMQHFVDTSESTQVNQTLYENIQTGHINTMYICNDLDTSLLATRENVQESEERLVHVLDDRFHYVQDVLSQTNVRQQEIIKDLRKTVTGQSKTVELQSKHMQCMMEQLKDACRINKLKQLNRIETTKVMIEQQTNRTTFIPTKAFRDAKEKLIKHNVVIIKGNSGDGKSCLAIQLLAWIAEGNNSADTEIMEKIPIQVCHGDSWDEIIAPRSKLAIFIDDISGNKHSTFWQSKENLFEAAIAGSQNDDHGNFMIVTVLNNVFESLDLSSKVFFSKDRIVDLSTNDSLSDKEKLDLLDVYDPKAGKDGAFSTSEKREILKISPPIGFPQCCTLYRNVAELQWKRVEFFRRPVQFMQGVLKKLNDGKCAALLYLFFCGGKVLQSDLDPCDNKVDRILLDAAFAVDIVNIQSKGHLGYEDKVRFVQTSFKCLLNSLVTAEETKDDVCYKFSHDSVKDTVALLYGKITLTGYIRHCHCDALSYLTTSKDSQNKIIMAVNNKHMYERLLREVKLKQSDKFKAIASLDIWNDYQFLFGFFGWLDGQSIDKYFHLNFVTQEERSYHQHDKDKYCDCSFIVYAALADNVSLLKMLTERTPIQHPQLTEALNWACSSGAEDCVRYLLSKGAKPDQFTLFCVVKGSSLGVLESIMKLDNFLETKAYKSSSAHRAADINLLHEACLLEREEIVKIIATKYPSLVRETDLYKQSVFHHVVLTGNIPLYRTMEAIVFSELGRAEREEVLCHLVDNLGMTIVHRGYNQGYKEMCVYLCETYPQLLFCKDKLGRTVLHMGCWRGDKKLSMYLCQTYPDMVRCRNNEERTILHESCIGGHMELSVYLCESYPELVPCTDKSGMTVLHLTCLWGHNALSVYLCQKYPNLMSCRDNYGWHTLHYIALACNLDLFMCVHPLLQDYYKSESMGYDIKNILTKRGKSVLDIANESWTAGKESKMAMKDYLSAFWPPSND